MYIHQVSDDFDPEQHFDEVPLHQGLFYRLWQQAAGYKTIGLAVSDTNGSVQVYVQCVAYPLPVTGSVWVADHGPIGTFTSPSVEAEFYQELKRLCMEESRTSHLRLQRVPSNDLIRSVQAEQTSGSFTQPFSERVLSLEDSLEDIAAAFSSSVRREIRLNERDGSTVNIVTEKVDFMTHFSEVYDLFTSTATHKKFSLHPRSYYESLFNELTKAPEYGALILGYVGSSERKLVSAILVVYTGSEAYHLFVGNLPEGFKHYMPTLTLYHALQEAKNQGLRRYNLGAVETTMRSSGDIGAFKKKFGGTVITHNRQRDIVTSLWGYLLFRLLRLPIIMPIRRFLTRWYRYTIAEMQSEEIEQ